MIKEKSTITDISQLKITSKQGTMVPIADLVDIKETISAGTNSKSRMLRRVNPAMRANKF